MQISLYKQILAIVVTARRPISLWELTALVEMPVDISDNLVSTLLEMPDDISKDLKSTPDDVPDDLESLRGIIRVCGSFLTLREQIIYFVYQSAQDFLLGRPDKEASRKAFNWVFPYRMEHVNNIIFSRSLNTMSTILKRDIYGLKEPGFPINEVQTPSPDLLATVRYLYVF